MPSIITLIVLSNFYYVPLSKKEASLNLIDSETMVSVSIEKEYSREKLDSKANESLEKIIKKAWSK
mgnify:CR=1 FL=1|tara:strand:+ start:254 stop:451 length:198 start_codon:yes stop_codon:yes gene_type:complete